MDAGKTGAYLAALRKARGMTQQEAADQLGVSNKTVSKWENGAGLPDITVLPALAELYGVTADDILAGETLRGRPAEAQGPARRRLLLLRLRTRFDLCFIGSLALGVLAAFRVAYVSLAAWPLSVGLLWIGYVLAVHPARYGDISLDAKIWENLYRKLLAASAVQWWALLRLVRLGRLEVDFAEMRYYDTMQAWKPLLFAVGLALLCAVLERALRRRMPLCCGYRSGCGQCSTGAAASCGGPGGSGWCGWRGRYFWRGCGSWRTASWTGCWRPGSPDMGKSWSKAVSRRAGPSCGGGWRRMWHSGSGCGRGC